ncbi:segregation/condensation protein A [Bdellovibrio sp. SKB1291214]|uniref:segregation and condensation protein A n=1 Tax=Bdellovibrio sp. SKB1291214 TaxID=1732569 RepID=UPI000B51520F|nr:segregation/condensation protein A [Bdellovibrio sp. SKB1291214]UYL08116.1 segregation/condensation protein A [Bdellovibrio sp. SKB1291214]
MSITVQLPKFEGPLGLLLYLIRKEEMDIMDIKIHEITKQYLDYIRLMKELDLEVAGEFIAMASTLIQIKSRMLLPQYDENGEVVEVEDPRKELVQKLLEYQKYQEAAKLLYDRPLVGRDVWLRGTRERLDEKEDEIILEDNALFSLISSYRKVLRSIKKKVHEVKAKAQSISSRVLELKDYLIVGRKVTMMELVTATEDRARQALITFLSLLELGKMGFVGLYQSEVYADIWVDTKKPIETDVLSRVEEYDSMGADRIAEQMMADAKKADPTEDLLDESADEAPAEQSAQMSFGETPMDFTAGMSDLTAEIAGMDAELDFLEKEEGTVELASDEEILAAEGELFAETVETAVEEMTAESEAVVAMNEEAVAEVELQTEALESPFETVAETISESFIETEAQEQLEEQLEVATFEPAEAVAVVAAEMVATSEENIIDTDPKTEAEA